MTERYLKNQSVILTCEICNETPEVCENLRKLTFALNVATLSADVYTSAQIQKMAREVNETTSRNGINLPKEIKDELARIGQQSILSFGKRVFWKEGQNILTTTEISRIGSWMSKSEYEQMIKTSQLQKRSGGLTHILLEGKEHYTNTAGKMYVEFDIPKNTTIIRGSGKGWGIFYEEGSSRWKFYKQKGMDISQPKVSNIKIIDKNGL